MKQFHEYKRLNLPELAREVGKSWEKEHVFEKSIENRKECPPFVFYEGPPSANGLPGIHHVLARTIKDIFCRYKTLKGYCVNRKAGWDTHGLPVELTVEKEERITKEDIGKKISIADYNDKCRKAVMRYTSEWESLTKMMGYWVDMADPYITYDNKYIESVWWLLKKLYDKQALYKGYSVQPYSPKAGTGLSSHELNLPGCYRNVKDQAVTAQFRIIRDTQSEFLFKQLDENPDIRVFFLAWTTTPWTLPSNTALAVGADISYVRVETLNQFTKERIVVILSENLLPRYFHNASWLLADEDWDEEVHKFNNDIRKHPPARKLATPSIEHAAKDNGYCIKGSDLVGIRYEQLLPFAQPMDHPEKAFRVISGNFVTTDEGTGIVHIAPTFGADDMQAAKKWGVPPLLVPDEHGRPTPLVDKQGRFVKQMGPYAGKYVKNAYYPEGQAPEKTADIELMIQLVDEGKCFSKEKYEHNYPHCWRTDKPILYYPLDSWFIRSSAAKEQMLALNEQIQWKPKSTGTGRFGEWLKNLHDWNLSRSRFWGIPLPIWRTEDGKETVCIGSAQELKEACEQSVRAGLMDHNPMLDFQPGNFSRNNYNTFDLHRPFVDDIILVSPSGKPMFREKDLIDVWFDSGAMPYAQFHYPFENKDLIDKNIAFPADFIAEGVDQTRGWFFTLHAIATLCFDSVAYKNVISNGLVLDKTGQKMSKRLGNAVNPFETIEKYGPDATRWYMITNAQPWDNIKFDETGIVEVQNKFFRALYNTYAFFALYANVDGFVFSEAPLPLKQMTELDRWITSRLNTLILKADKAYSDYEPTLAGRLIQHFVINDLSNWYVRLSRKRFWREDYSNDKISAYQVLYRCLTVISKLAAPIAPFYSDCLYRDLNSVTRKEAASSVHLADFPEANTTEIDRHLESRMQLAQQVTSLIFSLRKKSQIKVRQPLRTVQVLLPDKTSVKQLRMVKELILKEVNIKRLESHTYGTPGKFIYQIKPNYKTLGPKFNKYMKAIVKKVEHFTQDDIAKLQLNKTCSLTVNGKTLTLQLHDFIISTKEIPGWISASDKGITVALDTSIDEKLRQEGITRELVNRIQNLRKDSQLEVTDRIHLFIKKQAGIDNAVKNNLDYICSETLTTKLELVEDMKQENQIIVEVGQGLKTSIAISKIQ